MRNTLVRFASTIIVAYVTIAVGSGLMLEESWAEAFSWPATLWHMNHAVAVVFYIVSVLLIWVCTPPSKKGGGLIPKI